MLIPCALHESNRWINRQTDGSAECAHIWVGLTMHTADKASTVFLNRTV